MKKTMEKKITFRLGDAGYQLLFHVAEEQGFSVSTVVRSLVYRYLDEVQRYSKFKVLDGKSKKED